MTHKSSGLRLHLTQNLSGEEVISIDLLGDSHSLLHTKAKARTLARFLERASRQVERWSKDLGGK